MPSLLQLTSQGGRGWYHRPALRAEDPTHSAPFQAAGGETPKLAVGDQDEDIRMKGPEEGLGGCALTAACR